MGRRALRIGLCFCTTLLLACISPSDPLGREDALQEIQTKYTDLIRWGEIELAARYVDPSEQAAFLALASQFKDLRITDYEVEALGMRGSFDVEHKTPTREEDKAIASITVTYKGYVVSQMIERTVREEQEWYRDSIYNTWLVRPDLDGLLRGIRGVADTATMKPDLTQR